MQTEIGQIENVECAQQVEKVDDDRLGPSPTIVVVDGCGLVPVQADEVVAQEEELVTCLEDTTTDTADFTDYKTRVMEDLDALLANLQSTTANISSYQKSQKHQQTLPDQQHSCLSQNIPSSEDCHQTSQIPSHLNNNNQYNDYSSSKAGQAYQHHSSLNHPAGSRDQTNNQVHSFSARGYPTSRESDHSSGDNSGSSTPPPLPPPPSDILEYTDFENPIYEQQTFQIRETTPSSVSDSSDHAVPQGPQSKDRGQRMSALSSNISELDQLLLDLNSENFLAVVDLKSSNASEVTVLNGSLGRQAPPVAPKPASKPGQRTSVDNLLDQLEATGPQGGSFAVDPTYQELNTVPSSHAQHQNGVAGTVYQSAPPSSASSSSSYNQPQTASIATKELDELLTSLSEFTNKGEGTATNYNEPAYAKPVKSRTESSSSPTSPHDSELAYHHVSGQRQLQQRENGLEVAAGDHLEAMLGDLQSDLSRQGVSVKQKGICAACQKPIVGQVIAALGRTWHVEHFVCAHCEEPLGTRNFYERDSLAYCEKDYHQQFAPRCAYCNGPIVDKCITALERMWHPEHFFCAQCGRPFGEDDFHEKNGKAYCRDDYFQMFAPKCGGCAQPIVENYISALNRQWHPTCFVCWDCRAPFGAGSFFDYEGLPYCETHYHAKKGSLCASCEKPITGRCITAMFRKFHPEHFVCAFCLKQLNKGTFKEQNDKPYCHPCFVKLFG